MTPFDPIVRALDPDATLRRAWPLTGGISATVTALEVARADGTVERWVVRQHGAVDRARNPDIAADEYRLLHLLHASGLPVAEPLGVVAGGEGASPALVTRFVEGASWLEPRGDDEGRAAVMAGYLAAIHRVPTDALGFLPRMDDLVRARLATPPLMLDESLQEGRIRATLATRWTPSTDAIALLHGDFWPGNLLWEGDSLTAILDWEDAALGHPLYDLANTRMELLFAFGEAVMERFTHAYLDHQPLDERGLALWELVVALRPAGKLATWGLDPATERHYRDRHARFVAEAYRRLGDE